MTPQCPHCRGTEKYHAPGCPDARRTTIDLPFSPEDVASGRVAHNRTALTAGMDNVLAAMLGRIAFAAGDPSRPDVGDTIDRGLILRRLLEEQGFELWVRGTARPV